jgi:adenylate cyclase
MPRTARGHGGKQGGRLATAFGRSIIGRLASLPGILVVVLVALIAIAPPSLVGTSTERIGFLIFDAYQRLAPRPYQTVPVKVVDIDEETVRRLGQWPWPRTDIANLTDALAEAGAATIAFDIVFAEPDRTSPRLLAERLQVDEQSRAALRAMPDNDEVLARSIAQAPVVAGAFLTHDARNARIAAKAGFAVSGSPPTGLARFDNAIGPLPPLAEAARGIGFVSIVPDSDAIVRKAPLVARNGDNLLPSLSVEALRVAQGAGSFILKASDGSGEMGGAGQMVSMKVGTFEVPTTPSGELWIHYSEPVAGRVVPAWKILSGALSAEDMRREFEGHVVFVGAGAIGLRDLVSTPLQDRELGVMVHAQAAEQMIQGHFLIRPDWAPGLELVLLLVLGIGLAAILPRLGALRGALVGGLAIAALAGGSWYAFSAHRFLLDPTWPAMAVALAYLVQTILTFYREERQRAYIHDAFDRYLSPELVKRIADDPHLLELGGAEREMSILFCDIRSFSRISEKLTPQELIAFMVRFLTPMTDLLLAHKATIDKYIGDAILAFWNAPLDDPDHHLNAAQAALTMQKELKLLNQRMIERGDGSWPGDVKIGIGLNSGLCCVGNIGSQRRLSYSLIGDPVNLASRLEGLSKLYGVQIVMGADMHEHLPGFATLPLDCVRVVGRDAPEHIHALIGDAAVAGDEAFRAVAARHQAMLDAYHAQEFAAAAALLADNEQPAAAFGLTTLNLLYASRLEAFARTPPPSAWDGVYEVRSK